MSSTYIDWIIAARRIALGVVLALPVMTAPLAAQNGVQNGGMQSGDTNRIQGRVVDSTGAPIRGTIVHLSGTTMGAMSNGTGQYLIEHVPSGQYMMIVGRDAFAPDSVSVTVTGGTLQLQDITLRRAGATKLASVVVQAISPRLNETRAAALARQRNADNIVSVLSGDDIRSLPNANAAEAAGRIPGVATERDEGEGKFVQIRGTEPRLSNVTIDGVHIPGTEQGDRIPKLDDVPSDLLAAIEVSKTLTADMDADAIGGSVNLVTKTPTGAPRGYVAGQLGQSTLLSHGQGQGGFGYGGRFGDDGRLGVLIGASFDRNDRVINDVEPGWSVDNSGRSYPVEWDQRDYAYDRTRSGGGGDIDYRFADGSTLFLRGLWSMFHNYGTRYRFDVASNGDSSQVATPSGGIGTGATFSREVQSRTPNEQMYGFSAGGTHPAGTAILDYTINVGGTRQSDVNYRTTSFTYDGPGGNGVPLQYDASNHNAPIFHFVNPSDSATAFDPSNYLLKGYNLNDGLTTGRDIGGEVNALVPYQLGAHAASIKVGLKLRDEQKDFTSTPQKFAANTPVSLSQLLSGFSDPNFYSDIQSGFHMGPSPSNGAATAWENGHPQQFTNVTDTIGSQLDSFNGSERVYAGYLMHDADVGLLHINLGLRTEATQVHYMGHVATTPADASGTPTGPTTVSAVNGSQTYVDFFPSAQLRYGVDSATNLRVAVTRAIARPNYGDIAPHLSGEVCPACAHDFNNLSTGNPDLKPQHAWNVDLLATHYLSPTSVLSGGLFYKRITDFIYTRNFIYEGPVTAFDGYYGTRPENGGDGTLLGEEFDYVQQLTSLPGVLSGLGFDVNWTHVDSRATLLTDTATTAATLGHPLSRSVPLPRQSPNVGNVAVTYDLGRLSARAAWQYQGANVDSYGDGTRTAGGDTYFYPHSQLDASIILTVTPTAQLQLQGLDLNNAVFGFFNGAPGATYDIQREYYGRTIILGVKYGFVGLRQVR